MDKMRNAYFQKLVRQNRKKMIISLCAVAILGIALLFASITVQNMMLAIIIISSTILGVSICYTLLILNFLKKVKSGSYAFHLKRRAYELHHKQRKRECPAPQLFKEAAQQGCPDKNANTLRNRG